MKQTIVIIFVIILAIALGSFLIANLQPAATSAVTRTVTDMGLVNP